jgi:hypothetical protein
MENEGQKTDSEYLIAWNEFVRSEDYTRLLNWYDVSGIPSNGAINSMRIAFGAGWDAAKQKHNRKNKTVTSGDIYKYVREIEKTFDLPVHGIASKSKSGRLARYYNGINLVPIRQATVYIIKEKTKSSLKGIAKTIGLGDHSTAISMLKKASTHLQENNKEFLLIYDIINSISL